MSFKHKKELVLVSIIFICIIKLCQNTYKGFLLKREIMRLEIKYNSINTPAIILGEEVKYRIKLSVNISNFKGLKID